MNTRPHPDYVVAGDRMLELSAMTCDDVWAYAKTIDLPDFSKVRSSKALLVAAIAAFEQTPDFGGFV